MIIGFVAEPYEEHNASGMGFVVSELLKNLMQQGKGHEFVVYSNLPVSKTFIPGAYRTAPVPKGLLKKLWWFWRMPDEVDVLLFVAPLLPLILRRGIRSIIICQELGSQKIKPEGREALYAFVRDRMLMPLCLKRADVVAAASEATRQDLLHFYRIAPEKVVVIYDGYQDLTRYAARSPAIEENMKPYFFFAGKVKPRKNIHGLAKAFVDLKKHHPECKLVIAGDYGGEYYERIIHILRDGGVEKDVFFIGYINASELYAYYKNAVAVTFPSLNEGFGMPIIEAMSVGTPVITSNISSMAEAAGDAALLVDPHNPQDIARAMELALTDQALCAGLIAKGLERAKNFSWQKAAGEFLALIEHYGK